MLIDFQDITNENCLISFTVFDRELNSDIGKAELRIMQGKYWLNSINVWDDLMNRGYGKKVIKKIVEEYKPFRISLSDKTEHHRNSSFTFSDTRYLTWEGLHLVKSCFEKAILMREHFEFPFPKKLFAMYDELDFLNNKLSVIQNFSSSLNQIKKK